MSTPAERNELVDSLITFASSRGYSLRRSDFDQLSDEVLKAEVEWIVQHGTSSLVSQIGETIVRRTHVTRG